MSPGSRPSHGTFPDRFPATSRMPPRITSKTPNPSRIFPSSLITTKSVKLQRKLGLTAGRDGQLTAKMRIRGGGRAPPIRTAHDVPDLQQNRLDDLGERFGLVIDRGGNGLEPHRPTAVLVDDRREESAVQPIQPHRIHAFPIERVGGDGCADHSVAPDLTVVPDAAEQTVGDARRAS